MDGQEGREEGLEIEIRKLGRLTGELREYLRKLDYRFCEEPMGEEGTAWLRVLELFVGKPGIFGHERPLKLGKEGERCRKPALSYPR